MGYVMVIRELEFRIIVTFFGGIDYTMNDKRKICFVTPPLQMGGMERVVSLLSNHAAKNGYNVYIICLMNKKS